MKNKLIIIFIILIVALSSFFFLLKKDSKLSKNDNVEETKLKILSSNSDESIVHINESININDIINEKLIWESSNSDIATISNGVLTGYKSGNVILTSKINDKTFIRMDITIDKMNDKANVEFKRKKYDGEEIEASYKLDSNIEANISYYSDSECLNSVPVPKEIGTYYVVLTTNGNEMYKPLMSECIKAITISSKQDIISSDELLNNIDKNGVSMIQVATFSDGSVMSNKEYNTNRDEALYLSSASKTILGIIASLMQEDNIINLDTSIDTYWLNLNGYDFNTCTNDWKYYLNNVTTVRNYTKPGTYLAENHPTLRNLLTHSSTIHNMNMVYMEPGNTSSEYFGGGMSKTYDRALFMLKHTSHQLFEADGTPGASTKYDYQNDKLTRSHALAGFTMQVAMKESINEYSKKKFSSMFDLNSDYGYLNGNSIYFGTKYKMSAYDLAKIISAVANNGIYNGERVFSKNMVDLLKNKHSNLKNQTIAFDYVDGKYIKFGNYNSVSNSSYYGLSSVLNYVTFISFDENDGKGFVVNIQFNKSSAKANALNIFNNLQKVFYQ